MQSLSYIAGKQFLNAIDRMIGDMVGQHVAQIGLRINPVESSAADE